MFLGDLLLEYGFGNMAATNKDGVGCFNMATSTSPGNSYFNVGKESVNYFNLSAKDGNYFKDATTACHNNVINKDGCFNMAVSNNKDGGTEETRDSGNDDRDSKCSASSSSVVTNVQDVQ